MYKDAYLLENLKISLVFLLMLVPFYSLFAQAKISVERNTAIYEVGEWINFSLSTETTGLINYSISYGQHNSSLYQGSIQAIAGEFYNIPFRSTEPGFIQCSIEQNNQTQFAVAAISPFSIQALEPEPLDFDFFWSSVKAELAQIPIDPQLSEYSSSAYSTTYRISLANIGARRVYGYISIPVGEGPFPAILSLPDYGAAAGLVQANPSIAEQGNAISMSISIHNAAPDENDPLAYTPNIPSNRDSIYYKFAIMAAIRSIDYLFSRTDFDGESLGLIGVGQGAGLATCVAGIDDRVKILVSNAATLAQHSGYQYDRASGQPNYIYEARQKTTYTPTEELAIQQAVKYYDATYFAKRFEGASLSYIGYLDTNHPPATAFAIFNQLKGIKILGHSKLLAGEHPNYAAEKFQFFRTYFPAMMNPPNPTNSNSATLFNVSAGANQLIYLPASSEVTGIATWDGLDVSETTQFEWDLDLGPNSVFFTNPANKTTAIIFPQYGIFTIKLTATNESKLDLEGTIYSGVDYIYVGVSIF